MAMGAREQVGKYVLRGKLATGGMAEVFLARQDGPQGFAKTVVIKRIILPERNRKDLLDVPDQAKKEIEFIFASTMDDELKAALESSPFTQAGEGGGPVGAEPEKEGTEGVKKKATDGTEIRA